jgi:hypothetical protein
MNASKTKKEASRKKRMMQAVWSLHDDNARFDIPRTYNRLLCICQVIVDQLLYQ